MISSFDDMNKSSRFNQSQLQDQSIKLPSIEELFDMDLDGLTKLKLAIEQACEGNDNDNEDNDELEMNHNTFLEFINAEIRERNLMNDVVNYFLTAKPIEDDEVSLPASKPTRPSTHDDLSIEPITKPIIIDSLIYNTPLLNPIIPKSKPENIKDLLSRTRVDSSNFPVTIGASTLNKNLLHFSRPQRNTITPLKEIKANGRTIDKESISKTTRVDIVTKPKLPSTMQVTIGVPYISVAGGIKKKKKKKQHKKSFDFEKGKDPLQLRKEYVVPDITSFPKRKIDKEKDKKIDFRSKSFSINDNNHEKHDKQCCKRHQQEKKKPPIERQAIEAICIPSITPSNLKGYDNNTLSQSQTFEYAFKGDDTNRRKKAMMEQCVVAVVIDNVKSYDSSKVEEYHKIPYNHKLNRHMKYNEHNDTASFPNYSSNVSQLNLNETNTDFPIENDKVSSPKSESGDLKSILRMHSPLNHTRKSNEDVVRMQSARSRVGSGMGRISSPYINQISTLNEQIKEENDQASLETISNNDDKEKQHKPDDDGKEGEEEENNEEYNEEYEEEEKEECEENNNQQQHDIIEEKPSESTNTRPYYKAKTMNMPILHANRLIKTSSSSSSRSKLQQIKQLPQTQQESQQTRNQKTTTDHLTEVDKESKQLLKQPKKSIYNNNSNSSKSNTSINFYHNENNTKAMSSTVSSNFFNQKTLKPQSALPQVRQPNRIFSSKMSINTNPSLANSIVILDYSKVYRSFNELFNGFFLSSTYANAKHFCFDSTISSLYESFKGLFRYEQNKDLLKEKDQMYSDIVRAEAGIIENRLRKVTDRLIDDEDYYTSNEKYEVYKKVRELAKKDYATRQADEEQQGITNKMFFRVVLSRPEIYDIVCYILGTKEQWSELPHGLLLGTCWNLLWTYAPPSIDHTKIFSFQKVNHLINNRIIHRKDYLKKHISRIRNMNKKLNTLFDIMPKTFLLAKDYIEFIEEFHRIGKDDPLNLWIVKPVGKSRGKGIYLTNDISDVPLADSFLVQQYLTNPLLVDGYKFDMRIYVLVTSVNPLELFLYKDGFARVSTEKFNLFTMNRKIHLTNAAIQNNLTKNSSNYEKVYGGSKISLDILRYKLMKQNVNFDALWKQIQSIILKTMIASQCDIPYSPSSFELFGFDIIVDDQSKCWLLEVNSSPSLERSNALDDQIKLPLVNDILKIVEPMNYDREAILRVLERVLKINNSVNKDVYLYSPAIQLNMDLTQIFKGKIPRAYGDIPKDMGRFERLAPTKESDYLIKITGGQKYFGGKRDKE